MRNLRPPYNRDLFHAKKPLGFEVRAAFYFEETSFLLRHLSRYAGLLLYLVSRYAGLLLYLVSRYAELLRYLVLNDLVLRFCDLGAFQ